MSSIAHHTDDCPPTFNGPQGAANLNAASPCTISHCDHTCEWESDDDKPGSAVSRLHSRSWPSGLSISSLEFPPGEERDDMFGFYVPGSDDSDDLSINEARAIAADLSSAWELITNPPLMLPVGHHPKWCGGDEFGADDHHSEMEYTPVTIDDVSDDHTRSAENALSIGVGVEQDLCTPNWLREPLVSFHLDGAKLDMSTPLRPAEARRIGQLLNAAAESAELDVPYLGNWGAASGAERK